MNLLQRVTVAPGQSGSWRIEEFTVTPDQAAFENIRARWRASARGIEAGEYTRLMRKSVVVMSDTPAEMDDHAAFVEEACGNVLIAGLGLGMVLDGLLRNPSVQTVTVLEVSPDVIALTAPVYESDGRVTIVQADVFAWRPESTLQKLKADLFDFAWFDIWDAICADNVAQFKELDVAYANSVRYRGYWGLEALALEDPQYLSYDLMCPAIFTYRLDELKDSWGLED